MVTSVSWRPTSSGRAASLLLSGLFVAFLVTQAPHLVHHFFEPDHVQNECPYAASGDRTGGLQVEPAALVVILAVATTGVAPTIPVAPSVPVLAFLGRAPPVPVS